MTRKYLLIICFLISSNLWASELFLNCPYKDKPGEWVKLTADKTTGNGSVEMDNDYGAKCNVTYTSTQIIWDCPFNNRYQVDRETLEWMWGGPILGVCEIIETKNKI